jgi:hypothetical protein
MYYAYFDESGDDGYIKSPTRTFSLACLLVHDTDWLKAFDQTIALRRYIKANFRIGMRAELKAAWLIHNRGDVAPAELTFHSRMQVYKTAMRFQRKCGLFTAFAILIDKDRVQLKEKFEPRERAWHFAIQRLERFGKDKQENIHILPDEGHKDFIKKKLRKMRRFSRAPSAYGGGSLARDAVNIIEDPSDRRSRESYFVQLCDLNAYAAFRKVYPGADVDATYWDQLGEARLSDVNKVSDKLREKDGPQGIVVWPK